VVLFPISRFLILKSATDPISIENSLSADIGQVTNFRGLKLDQRPILVMEIGSLNQPLSSLFYLDIYGMKEIKIKTYEKFSTRMASLPADAESLASFPASYFLTHQTSFLLLTNFIGAS
jgi:hypothetical protein